MLRNLVVLIFLFFFCSAGWIFLSHRPIPLRENLADRECTDPLIHLEEFVLYEQQDGVPTQEIRAKVGAFYRPNRIEVSGDFRIWRMRKGESESLEAQYGIGWLRDPEGEFSLTHPLHELDRALVKHRVTVRNHGHRLYTEEAEYESKTSFISGTQPVRVEGETSWMMGDQGFKLHLEEEVLHLLGHVRGAAQSASTP